MLLYGRQHLAAAREQRWRPLVRKTTHSAGLSQSTQFNIYPPTLAQPQPTHMAEQLKLLTILQHGQKSETTSYIVVFNT